MDFRLQSRTSFVERSAGAKYIVCVVCIWNWNTWYVFGSRLSPLNKRRTRPTTARAQLPQSAYWSPWRTGDPKRKKRGWVRCTCVAGLPVRTSDTPQKRNAVGAPRHGTVPFLKIKIALIGGFGGLYPLGTTDEGWKLKVFLGLCFDEWLKKR